MRKIALAVALAATALSGCGLTTGLTSPAPLNSVVIDDRAVRYAFLTLDTLATLADAAIDAKLITPGSAKAKAVASGLRKAQAAVNAASYAQKAGSLTDYNKAFEAATAAIAEVKRALGKNVTLLTPDRKVTVDTAATRLMAA
jgi:hypothetical protein